MHHNNDFRASSASNSSRPRPRRRGQAARDPQPGGARPAFLLGDLRRRRLDPRPHPRDRARNPGQRHRSGAAPVLHRLHPRQHPRDAAAHTVTQASAISSRCAATCPPACGRLGEFRYANELVSFIRAETGDHFHIEVAGLSGVSPAGAHAPARSAQLQAQGRGRRRQRHHPVFLQRRRLFPLRGRCEALGIDLPIVPGIMPITNYTQLARFSDACGAEIPRWIRKRLESFGDDMRRSARFGVDVVTGLCDRLLDRRRARPALLHHEPGGANGRHLEQPRPDRRRLNFHV